MGPPFSVKFTSEKETDELWILFLLYANTMLANAFSVDLILTPPWPRSSSQYHHHLPFLGIKLCHTGIACQDPGEICLSSDYMLLKCWGKHYWKMLYLHKTHFWWFDFLRTPWTLAVWWRRASRKKKINPSSFLTSSSSPWPLPLWCSLVIWWRPGKWLCG